MALKVYNMLTRRKEKFVPLHSGRVGIYVCGPTVYDHAHLGHAKTYISFDVIVRYLRYLGYKVRYVQNITDVGHLLDTGEDRILLGAERERIEPMEVVEKYTRSYFEDMDALNVQRPDISPRASGHILEQIELIEILLDKGYAYEANGSVYFDITKFQEYGKLSRRSIDEQEAGARIEVSPDKRHPADFALWRRADPRHIMKWRSPWGWGYPGWHIECSTMSMKYLGETFDIHGGGIDNVFPHNECEIAQSEAATGKTFARYWLLAGTLLVNGIKMSKSLGNFITIKDALKKYKPEEIRFFIIKDHYRSPLDFSETSLVAAGEGLNRIHQAVNLVRSKLKSAASGKKDIDFSNKLAKYKSQFLEAMDDDFNTASAVSLLFELTREVNSYLTSSTAIARETLDEINKIYTELGDQILGILPFSERPTIEAEPFIKLLIDIRQELRNAKQWELADKIRAKLKELKVTLEDGRDGTTWRII
ncbi:MAG TPA: cysteine--tRNA ligase [bacterium (Candidatus Stahlbacteria)]|nr:cysteine--tRNA ligase [Candidatus Stahlbacteria bacterium]